MPSAGGARDNGGHGGAARVPDERRRSRSDLSAEARSAKADDPGSRRELRDRRSRAACYCAPRFLRWVPGLPRLQGRGRPGHEVPKKKGPPASQRPKSREETPKEGGGVVQGDDTALHKYAPAPHKKQVSLTYSSHGC